MDNPAAEIRYSHRAKPYSSHIDFTLDAKSLTAEKGRSNKIYPLDKIERIRLSYTPKNICRLTFLCEVIATDGQSVRFDNLDWKSLIAVERENAAFRAFVTALVTRAKAANRKVILEAGCNRLRYRFTQVIGFGLIGALGLTGLYAAGQAQVVVAGGAFALAVYLFIWLREFLGRNRPRPFEAEAIPENLLPPL